MKLTTSANALALHRFAEEDSQVMSSKLETDKALKVKVLVHWEGMREYTPKDFILMNFHYGTPWAYDCDFCSEYLENRPPCNECPIYIKTQLEACKGSPYGAALGAFTEAEQVAQNEGEHGNYYVVYNAVRRWRRACDKMIVFINDLEV